MDLVQFGAVVTFAIFIILTELPTIISNMYNLAPPFHLSVALLENDGQYKSKQLLKRFSNAKERYSQLLLSAMLTALADALEAPAAVLVLSSSAPPELRVSVSPPPEALQIPAP